MTGLDAWTWASRPTTPREFDDMMSHLDDHLALHGYTPAQRSVNAARLVSRALGLDGTPIFGGGLERGAPFGPRDLIMRVFEWFKATYGDRNNIDMSLGYTVLPLRGTYWRLRIPRSYGTVVPFADRNLENKGRQMGTAQAPATYNVLTGLKGATQQYVGRLTDAEIARVLEAYYRGFVATAALNELEGSDLFDQARSDYAHSVNALTETLALNKARWDTAQCAEKALKGLLDRAGQQFPKDARRGHDIPHLGGLVTAYFGIALAPSALGAIHCPPMVRYGEMNVDANEAWTSHDALLHVLGALRTIARPTGATRSRP
jgi:hypothetical protein